MGHAAVDQEEQELRVVLQGVLVDTLDAVEHVVVSWEPLALQKWFCIIWKWQAKPNTTGATNYSDSGGNGPIGKIIFLNLVVTKSNFASYDRFFSPPPSCQNGTNGSHYSPGQVIEPMEP